MLEPPSSPASAGAAQSSGGGGALSQATSQQVGKDGFLKMLVTQLKNQNPTDPMKGRDFASQLAQFSSVEQLTSIGDQLEAQKSGNKALMRSVNSGVATDLIGRTVEAKGNQFSWNGEGETTLGMDLNSSASEVTVTIRDDAGNAVRTRTLENVQAGSKEITWDGTSDAGNQVPNGDYSFEIEATNPQGESVEASPYLKGSVDRISFGKDGTKLWVNGAKISMDRVRSVAAP
ncbi:MAG: flagellar hook assembly protein FlgD [Salinibacter sp.]